MKKIHLTLSLLGLLCLINSNTIAQISQGGIPPSFNTTVSAEIDVVDLPAFDVEKALIEDEEDGKNGKPYRIAQSIPVDLNMKNSGTWTDLPEGGRIWRLKIRSEGALALGVYYNNFYLPPKGKLFLYNEDKTQLIGAFTEFNNHESGYWATGLIQGETVTLEFVQSERMAGKAVISISEIAYTYRGVSFSTKDFGDSESCEVNINCSPEGDSWQDEKRGVSRILTKVGSNYYWCTGSLVNNVRADCTPYYLTAFHCGDGASAADHNQWQFYFNYEASGCSNPSSQPSSNTLTGATLKAEGNINGGSDFLLFELNNPPQISWNIYMNGWYNVNSASSGGAGIHHPAGDIKKISTYTSSVSSSTPNIGGDVMASNGAWQINGWGATTNGQGVTEGGSSGSPLFDSNGRIVGTLTGGSSYCNTPNSPDYYGKFSYHWASNGSSASNRLRDWLDPDNTGATSLAGIDYPCSNVAAAFSADITNVLVNDPVVFTDGSIGNITSWSWNFGANASPATANTEGPHNVTYSATGLKTVELTVSDGTESDTETRTDYITVQAPQNSFSLDFESCADFSTNFLPWILNDVDATAGYGSNDYDFPGEGLAMAFMAFNPSQTTPSASGDAALQPHGGVRFGASFAVPAKAPNNDWLISPKVQLGSNSSFSLWVKTYKNDWGEERYRIGVSTTDENPNSFTIISSGSYEESSTTWQQKIYDISAYDNQEVHLGINCVSNDAFIFMIDDISINTITGSNDDIEIGNKINVYPNPAVDFVNVDLGNISNAELVVFDVCGKAVKQINANQSKTTINLSELSKGVYYINIKTDNNTIVKKITLVK